MQDAYYWVKDWFRPYNCLKIRNVPHTYSDADVRAFHAAFSVMCNWVEAYGVNHLTNSMNSKRHNIKHLYQWYTSTDWSKDVSCDTMKSKFAALVDNYECMW